VALCQSHIFPLLDACKCHLFGPFAALQPTGSVLLLHTNIALIFGVHFISQIHHTKRTNRHILKYCANNSQHSASLAENYSR